MISADGYMARYRDFLREKRSYSTRNPKLPQTGRPADGEDSDRKSVVNAFFQKKERFPTPAQLRMFTDG